jgi:hypothetical protein
VGVRVDYKEGILKKGIRRFIIRGYITVNIVVKDNNIELNLGFIGVLGVKVVVDVGKVVEGVKNLRYRREDSIDDTIIKVVDNRVRLFPNTANIKYHLP